ncbi:imelysin family protein [Streptomyces sp. NPDC014776]|uniref:imelysin family protein n=1 Tax=unclassified Streptomyces TaxID=2593676 RepID=UPI0036FFFC35
MRSTDSGPARSGGAGRRRLPRAVRGRRRYGALLAVGALVTAGALAAQGVSASGDAHPRAGTGSPVEAAPGRCGAGWAHPHPGPQRLTVRNGGNLPVEVRLQDAASGAVLAEVEELAPGTSRPMPVRLGPGTYRLLCLPSGGDAMSGPAVPVSGPGERGPAVRPVTEHDLIPVALAYQRWVTGRLTPLQADADALRDALSRGERGAARRAWQTAHLSYERLGAAYGAFGELNDALDGTADGLPHGTADRDFTGFHRIEYGLWHGESLTRLRTEADRLTSTLARLRAQWARTEVDPADIGLRAHEIVEDTIELQLSGRTDYGSGTTLATARADLDGTAEVLGLLRPLLTSRLPHPERIDRALDTARRRLDAQRHDGTWTPLRRLGRTDRERIDAAFGDLVEELAPVAVVCEPRRTA